ncbi:MAG: hypothetical protein HY222_06170 [Thaumarchaeota archaeon]|nr:hypothetical protein [Nitrososphaerota archaeon]MBI3641962.1 hypothetical protein [Nitrososphaerota archaeon]
MRKLIIIATILSLVLLGSPMVFHIQSASAENSWKGKLVIIDPRFAQLSQTSSPTTYFGEAGRFSFSITRENCVSDSCPIIGEDKETMDGSQFKPSCAALSGAANWHVYGTYFISTKNATLSFSPASADDIFVKYTCGQNGDASSGSSGVLPLEIGGLQNISIKLENGAIVEGTIPGGAKYTIEIYGSGEGPAPCSDPRFVKIGTSCVAKSLIQDTCVKLGLFCDDDTIYVSQEGKPSPLEEKRNELCGGLSADACFDKIYPHKFSFEYNVLAPAWLGLLHLMGYKYVPPEPCRCEIGVRG